MWEYCTCIKLGRQCVDLNAPVLIQFFVKAHTKSPSRDKNIQQEAMLSLG